LFGWLSILVKKMACCGGPQDPPPLNLTVPYECLFKYIIVGDTSVGKSWFFQIFVSIDGIEDNSFHLLLVSYSNLLTEDFNQSMI